MKFEFEFETQWGTDKVVYQEKNKEEATRNFRKEWGKNKIVDIKELKE